MTARCRMGKRAMDVQNIERATSLFESELDKSRRHADRMFAVLMAIQFVGAVVAVLVLSPRTWIGAQSAVHVHVWATIGLGAVLALLPLVLVLTRPGAPITRFVIAFAQTMFSALLIHVTGGRIETHFHVFGSLAFLAFYRDYRVLAIATFVTAADHFVRGMYFPQSVFGVADAAMFRWVEHTGWVAFEVIFLSLSIHQSRRQVMLTALRSAELEASGERIETLLQDQTRELDSYLAGVDAATIVVVTDLDGTITSVNDNFCALSGYAREELTGQNPRILSSGRHSAAFFDAMFETISSGRLFRDRIQNRARDGSIFWLDMTIVPLLGNDGLPVQYVALSVDMTQLKMAELELRDAMVSAKAANRAKTEFLANMSHEIRTPMNAILGYTELLDGPTDASLPIELHHEYLATIRRNGDHLLAIINDILDISKIEDGTMTVESIDVDPIQILQGAISLMGVKARAKGLELNASFCTPIPTTIASDPVRLRQILVNVIGNGIKFTEVGSVTVIVRHDHDAEQLTFDVKDTGIGIDAECIDDLFDPFSQADTSTTRRFGGTGLGLGISRRLATILGGTITVDSQPGQGSTFSISVSTGDTRDVPHMTPEEAGKVVVSSRPRRESTLHESGPALQGKRILLIEDGPDNQRLIAFHLRKAGADVTVADNGDAGVRLLTQAASIDGALIAPSPFDLILTDMQMPVMDGYDATRLLRRKGCTLPIIALTAHAMDGDEARCLDAGCDTYATKPIDRDSLIEVCRTAHHKLDQAA
ncbi:MAG: ATP-binding protein [Planctomycetota bacterium]